MFQVNRAENRLRKLEERRFSDLKLREREHLQEWLANMPTALGEELLIIHKEFEASPIRASGLTFWRSTRTGGWW